MVIMRGSSKPSAKTDILKPGGRVIDLPGIPGSGPASPVRGIAVGAGESGSWLGPPMVNVQALKKRRPSTVKRRLNIVISNQNIYLPPGYLATKSFWQFHLALILWIRVPESVCQQIGLIEIILCLVFPLILGMWI